MIEILDTLFLVLLGLDFFISLILSLLIGVGAGDPGIGLLAFIILFIAIMIFGSLILITGVILIFPLVEALL